MQVGTWQQARQADTYPLGSDVQKKGPQKYRKRRKLFPFHEYGKVWNARQVIVLTSNQSLTMLDGKWEDSKGVFKWEKSY